MAKSKEKATPRVAADLNAELEAARSKKAAQKLADDIFGGKARGKAGKAGPKTGAGVRKVTGGGLESRISRPKASGNKRVGAVVPAAPRKGRGGFGVQHARHTSVLEAYAKAAAEAKPGDINLNFTINGHRAIIPEAQVPTGPKGNRAAPKPRNGQLNTAGNGTGLQIKGLAGPCAVHAEGFAPGTTAEDIQEAMKVIKVKVLKCSIISRSPVVVAEIFYNNRDDAQKAVSAFDGQIGDGRELKLAIKPGAVSARDLAPSPIAPAGPLGRNRSDSEYTEYASKLRPAEIIDGSYGFGNDVDMDRDDNYSRPPANRAVNNDYSPSYKSYSPAPRGPRSDYSYGRGRGRSRGGRDYS